MKNINRILVMLTMVSIFLISCEDDDKKPFTIDEVIGRQGSILRITDVEEGVFDLFRLDTSNLILEVEAFTQGTTNTVANVAFTVEFLDGSPGNGTIASEKTDLDVYSASDFQVNPQSGLPRLEVDYSAAEILALLGIAESDLDGGDVFRFEWTLTTTDGKVFNRLNSSNSVEGETFYSSPFLYDLSVVCPLTPGFATGDYELRQIVGSADPFFGEPVKFYDNVVTLEVGSTPTRRAFDLNYISFDLTMELNFVCNQLLVPSQQSGVGCGGSVIWQTDAVPATYDPTDDSVITINLFDDAVNDCGLQESMVLTLTKI